jgi:SOS-response transcriptional repressor LexA
MLVQRIRSSMHMPERIQKNFYKGDIIIIDEEKKVKHGDFVIAILPRTQELTFKQYVIDGGVHYLKPLNRKYPLITIKDEKCIYGVVLYNLN